MSQFWFYFELGLDHVLDWNAYDHVLFIIVLVASYSFQSWLKLLWLITIFTLGHTLALLLASYGVVSVSSRWIEMLIAVTIFITACYNLLTAKKKENQRNVNLLYFATAFFGVIHGFGFSSYFNMVFSGSGSKFLSLIEFALGIEVAHLIVAFAILLLAFICQHLFRVNRRDWILVVSSIVIGIILPILRENLEVFF